MITHRTCGSLSKTKIWKDAIGIECSTKKKFCVLPKKVLSFGPNRTVEVRPNSSAESNVRSVTTTSTLHRHATLAQKLNSYPKYQRITFLIPIYAYKHNAIHVRNKVFTYILSRYICKNVRTLNRTIHLTESEE